VLPNGLIVLTERMEHLRSVAMGIWVKSGSRYEAAEINGISHFVEHMLFKGTKSRSAQHIAREMDAIGGNLDALPAKRRSASASRRSRITCRLRSTCSATWC
jgi:predicted Zn-dependent peptidase